MTALPYAFDPHLSTIPPMGLIVLQTDETLEPEFSAYFADRPCPIYVSRIPSAAAVSATSLAAMETALPAAADLLPKARPYRVVGYGCTSASSVIGSQRVEQMVQQRCDVVHVTNPLRAAHARAEDLGVSRLALLSPYVEEVTAPLRTAFAELGITTDVLGSFQEPDEANVVRISTNSIVEAAVRLGSDPSAEAVFLSCTNLRTRAALPEIEARISKPVLSSNQCLAWHMRRLNGIDKDASSPPVAP